MSAHLILAIIATLAIWAGRLYLAPFGRCGKCKGTGHVGRVKGGKRRVKVKVCPRCKGLRRVQRRGSRTIHQAARKIRQGRQAAARYQQQEEESHHGHS